MTNLTLKPFFCGGHKVNAVVVKRSHACYGAFLLKIFVLGFFLQDVIKLGSCDCGMWQTAIKASQLLNNGKAVVTWLPGGGHWNFGMGSNSCQAT